MADLKEQLPPEVANESFLFVRFAAPGSSEIVQVLPTNVTVNQMLLAGEHLLTVSKAVILEQRQRNSIVAVQGAISPDKIAMAAGKKL